MTFYITIHAISGYILRYEVSPRSMLHEIIFSISTIFTYFIYFIMNSFRITPEVKYYFEHCYVLVRPN